MKTTAVLACAMLSLLVAAGAQGAAITQEPHQPLAAPAPEQDPGALMFPLPKFPNPWESAAEAHRNTAPTKGSRTMQALTLPAANYPFESHAADQSRAEVARTAQAARISEPASELLMLAGLSALAIAIRRKMPE